MSCQNCQNCVMVDHGYSSYTVEGTIIHCAAPDLIKRQQFVSFDSFYGKAEEYNQGENCEYFVEGTPLSIDVDRENKLDPEEQELYDRIEDNL